MNAGTFFALQACLEHDCLHIDAGFPVLGSLNPLVQDCSGDVRTIIERLCILGKAFDAYLITGRKTPDSLLLIFVDPRLEDRLGLTPCIVRAWRQYLHLWGKNRIFPAMQSDLECWNQFVLRQDEVRLSRSPIGHPVWDRAKVLLTFHLKQLDLDTITPGHGPGAVAEPSARDDRYAFKSWYSPAQRAYPFESHGRLSTQTTSLPIVTEDISTRVVMVAKDFRKRRIISVEPASQQYLQQGQMKAMYLYISRCRLQRYVDLRDQTRAHRLLKSDRDIVTLDLSDASDRISWRVVHYLFPSGIRRALFATRTPTVTYLGQAVRLAAFAPMGSAVCFPVETLVFLAVVMAAWDLRFPKDRLRSLPANVFGDDIALPSAIRPLVVEALEWCGMVINDEKSTTTESPFRESCGLDMWKGIDVTPCRIKNDVGCIDTQTYLNALNHQPLLYKKELWSTAGLLSDWCQAFCPTPVITSHLHLPPGFLLGCKASYDSCETRWNRRYQRMEVRTFSTKSRSREWSADPQLRLLARCIGDSIDRVPLRGLKIRKGWTFAQEYA